jgi:uncharacterized Zn finger protein
MAMLPTINQKLLSRNCPPKVISSGTEYYRRKAVDHVVVSNNFITAEVLGGDTYQINIHFTNHQIEYAECDCPYGDSYEGWCKHIVATLLYVNDHADDLLQQQQTIEQYKNLNNNELIALIEYLIEHEANNASYILQFLKASSQQQVHSDLADFRIELVQAFRKRVNEYYIATIAKQIQKSINELRTEEALTMLSLVFDRYVEFISEEDNDDDDYYGYFDDYEEQRYDEHGDHINYLSSLLTQALLDSNLDEKQSEHWANKIDNWFTEDEYLFESLNHPSLVLEELWDSGLLSEAMQAHISSDQFVQANYKVPFAQRIMSLYRRNLVDAGDNLSKSCNLFEYMVIDRIRRGQLDEAFRLAKKHFQQANQVAMLGQALSEHGNTHDLLHFGELGTQLQAPYEQLDAWLNPVAFSNKRYDLVLFLNQQILLQAPDPIRFVQTKKIANDKWPQIRERLMRRYRRIASSNDLIEILLEEGEIDLAIQKIKPILFEDTILAVMRAASATHPVWIKQITEQFAHTILEAGKSQNYPEIIQRLQIAKTSLTDTEWLAFAHQLFEQYRRKRAFIEQIRKLEPRLPK